MLSERHLLSCACSEAPLFMSGGRLSLLLADVFPVFLLVFSIMVLQMESRIINTVIIN